MIPTRRFVLRIGGLGMTGVYASSLFRPWNARAEKSISVRGTAEYCIFVYLEGGASHIDTFDLKETQWQPKDFDVRTVTPGIKLPYSLFPKMSTQLGKVTLVRSLAAWERGHDRARYYLQVGHPPSPAREKEMPSQGSVIAYEMDRRRRPADFLPPYVAIDALNLNPLVMEGCLDARFAPTPLGLDQPFALNPAEAERFARRWEFLKKLDAPLREAQPDGLGSVAGRMSSYYEGTWAMMREPRMAQILNVTKEERTRYGNSKVGDACLLARNLIQAEAGTRYVMVSHNGWDHHANLYDAKAHPQKCKELDACLSSLLEDLAERKHADGKTLLEKTLIVCLGEFGRAPGEPNLSKGRDHYPQVNFGIFGGAGIPGGRVLGASDAKGEAIVDFGWHKKRPIYPEDLVATVYSALGIDWTKRLTNTPSGRDFQYIEPISQNTVMDVDEIRALWS